MMEGGGERETCWPRSGFRRFDGTRQRRSGVRVYAHATAYTSGLPKQMQETACRKHAVPQTRTHTLLAHHGSRMYIHTHTYTHTRT